MSVSVSVREVSRLSVWVSKCCAMHAPRHRSNKKDKTNKVRKAETAVFCLRNSFAKRPQWERYSSRITPKRSALAGSCSSDLRDLFVCLFVCVVVIIIFFWSFVFCDSERMGKQQFFSLCLSLSLSVSLCLSLSLSVSLCLSLSLFLSLSNQKK